MWEPLPLIVYGHAIHPLIPSRRETRHSTRNRLSTVTEASSTDDHSTMRDVVSLEVGDEVYAFEKYIPTGRDHVEGIWYRGYVLTTIRLPPVTWSASDPSSSTSQSSVKEQVYIGIFPASHIFVRDELADAEGRLPDLARSLQNGGPYMTRSSPADHLGNWNRDKASLMGTLREEDEDDGYSSRKSFKMGPPPDQANSSRAALSVYPASLRSASPADSQLVKPLPPRPSRKSGDDTASGRQQPIIDEIASALREWHTLMFQYLARRDYKLFHIVREHIEILHSGRRQLLAQTLGAEETVNLRRDCVTRLVIGNLIQGLEVIVRHPTWGGLVTVDAEGDIDPRSWVSAIRMYAMQVSLAYLNVTYDDRRPYPLGTNPEFVSSGPLPTPGSSAFPDLASHHKARSRSSPGYLEHDDPQTHPATKFYHVFLELRAFVASPCTPGETAELYFSLYRKQGTQFVTEEFCAILNHNGMLSRDPSSRIRTLFVDLAASDIQDPIYLVCCIVRNGTLKPGYSVGSNSLYEGGRRGSETSSRLDLTSPTMSTMGYDSTTTLTSPSRANGFGEQTQARRPFGCAVLELTQLSQMLADQSEVSTIKEHTMPIYVPANEMSFSMIHQNIISNNVREFEKSSRADHLAVSIKVFHGNAKTVVRENTALLQDTPRTLRLGFPDVVFPGDARNELYVKLWCGDFTSSQHGSGRLSVTNFARAPSAGNVQITVEVKDQNGTTIENVISQGSGEPLLTQFNSLVFLRCNEPTFGELIKIQLPSDGMPQWHLFFTFRNKPTRTGGKNGIDTGDKPFAFAFQPLFPDARSFVDDGSHTLLMYRADRLNNFSPSLYLGAPARLPAGQKPEQIGVPAELMKQAPLLRDTLTIRSSLCSTKHTQDDTLLRLLNWERQDRESLSGVLSKFTFVGEGEIVKFLRSIFDSLFGILVSSLNHNSELDSLVFNALVTVLGIVQDRRFSNFQPVLDIYIAKHYNCVAAASPLIHSMSRLLNNPGSPETASHLRKALKVWHYLFKFIARSRELQKVKEVGMGAGATLEYLESKFKRELRSLLSGFTEMMSTSSPPSIVGAQTIALQHFTSILPELAKTFTPTELVSLATTFANAVTIGKGKIVIWKLIMYLHIVKGFLFDNAESRPLLIEAVVSWIKPHFGRYDEYSHTTSNDTEAARDAARVNWLESIRICITIIAVMLDKLHQNIVNPEIIGNRKAYRQEQDNIELLLPLLPRILDSYREFQSSAMRRTVEKLKTPKASVPVTFPESYPFSLASALPESPRGVSNMPLHHENHATFYPGLGETAIVFLVLILCSPTDHITSFLQSSFDIEGRERFVQLLSQFAKVSTSILENDAFPKAWMNVNILAHKVLIKMMEPIAVLLEREFIPSQEQESTFDSSLWREALHMLLKLLSSDQLMIEDFSPQKRRAVWRLTGDIRGEGAAILLNLWQALGSTEHMSTNGEVTMRYGGYQVYLHALVGHVVNLCLSHHDQLRSNAVQILYSMIVSEYHQSEHFDGIENELVTRLDSLFMSGSKGDDISRAFFIGQLRSMFDSSDVDEALREQLSIFLDSVDLFLELLLSVRALPEGEEYADDRVIATLRLMNFIRRIGRDEIYIKYVHQLVNMHLATQNYVEAALTLKLHADLHTWDLNTFVPPMEDLGLPQQSHFHRKETLYLLILDYLGRGKAWENAVDICKELAQQHTEITFNYGRLSEILRHQAILLEHIVTEQRHYPDYYRVTFFGSFPAAIRDKKFIYRGYEWEKYGAFCERMLSKHPGSHLFKPLRDPPPDIRFGNDQYIQCTAVTPEPDRNLPVFVNPDVPLAIRTYYEHSAINVFSSSLETRKTTRDGVEEVWTEKTYYTTEQEFPTVLRRSEVVNIDLVEISPLQKALDEVEEKTKELQSLYLKYQALAKTSQEVGTSALAGSLNGAVDWPANTGIAFYRQTFFAPDYVARHPERAEIIERLRTAIDEHVRVIDSCLKLHGLLCPPNFISFHETLQNFFRKNFREEIRRLVVDSDSITVSTASRGYTIPSGTSQYNPSSYEHSVQRSASSASTARFVIPPLNVGRSIMSLAPSLDSPISPGGASSIHHGSNQSTQTGNGGGGSKYPTILQRNLAHLTRHGINGVASAPGDMLNTSDSLSAESPHNSFVNVSGGNGSNGGIHSLHTTGQASVATSYMGSAGSLNSLKGRFSRLGSINFGRRGRNS